MFRFPVVIVVLLLFSFNAIAQRDSLQVVSRNDKWMIKHDAKLGETIFSIARKYHVPPAILADANGMNYQAGLENGQDIYIPLGAYNQIVTQPINNDVRPLYYIVDEYDNLYRISKYAGVQQKKMQQWNGLPDNAITEGQHLFVGWILYDATSINNETLSSGNSTIIKNTPVQQAQGNHYKGNNTDTVIVIQQAPVDTISPMAKIFLSQTNNGQNVVSEKGTAVFFDMGRKISKSKVIYAFHNTAKKGTIIKVFNPGNNTIVYVKVLGPIPGTKQYHDSIIGIDDSAKKILEVQEERMWCELEYSY